MLSAGVACWYLANSPRLPFVVVAGLLVVLAGLWWFCAALEDVDLLQLQARNLPRVPRPSVEPPLWPYGWAGVAICAFLVLGFVAATLSLPAAVFPTLAVLAVAMLTVIGGSLHASPSTTGKCSTLRAYRPVLTTRYNGDAVFQVGLWRPYLARTREPFTE